MGRKLKQLNDNITEGNTVKIAMTNGSYSLVDKEMLPIVSQYRWSVAGRGYSIGNNKDKKLIKMHHLVLPRKSGYVTDHINQDKLDNRRENLRYVNQSLNTINGKIRGTNKTGVIGVSWCAGRSRWRASIIVNGKQTNRYFKDIKDAILYRKQLEAEVWQNV